MHNTTLPKGDTSNNQFLLIDLILIQFFVKIINFDILQINIKFNSYINILY